MNNLDTWGWSEHEEQLWQRVPPGVIPARVTARFPSHWRVIAADGRQEELAELSGAFQYTAAGPEDFPVVGDWVAVSPEGWIIRQVLPRRSAIVRQEAGRAARAQVLAANVDTALLVFGLDGGRNFSVGLLERFLTVTAAGGVHPVVVLNKADAATVEQIEAVRSQVAALDTGMAVYVTSAETGAGLSELRGVLSTGRTACCLGRSGVGKSSIINALLGEQRQATKAVSRIENKGRHTTSASQLLQLPEGMVIDTPGLRELQLWGDPEALQESFTDIYELAAECRFADCRHQGEPGCAVQAAAASGLLPQQRLEHYLEQRDELAEAELRRRMSADAYEKQKWKKVAKDIRRMMKQ